MEKICLHWNKSFEAKREDAKYCSNSCRTFAYRVRNNIPEPFKKVGNNPEPQYDYAFEIDQVVYYFEYCEMDLPLRLKKSKIVHRAHHQALGNFYQLENTGDEIFNEDRLFDHHDSGKLVDYFCTQFAEHYQMVIQSRLNGIYHDEDSQVKVTVSIF